MQIIEVNRNEGQGINSFSTHAIADGSSFMEVLAGLDQVAAQTPHSCYITVEFPSQLEYTMGHATERFEFDTETNYDEPEVDSDAKIYRRTYEAFRDPNQARSWESLSGKMTATDDDLDQFIQVHTKLDHLVEPQHFVQQVPSDDPIDYLACAPNGYFDGDFNPFENAAIVRRFCGTHGLRFLGMGAESLVFITADRLPPKPPLVAAIIADMKHLYGNADSAVWQEITRALAQSAVVVLSYSRGFFETIDFEEDPPFAE